MQSTQTSTTTSLSSSQQPLKPIYKHPLKPSTTNILLKPTLTPTPPPKTTQAHAQWLRIMQTKQNQWRLINTIALHELNLLERSACKQLDSLAENLDNLIQQTATLDNLLIKCRSIRAQQTFLNIAAPPLTRAIRILHQLHYSNLANPILENRSAIQLPAPNIENELVKFRHAANSFANAASKYALHDLAAVAHQLELLATVAGNEPPAVSCAAHAVVHAAHSSETARLHMVDTITENHTNAFVPDPSFVE